MPLAEWKSHRIEMWSFSLSVEIKARQVKHNTEPLTCEISVESLGSAVIPGFLFTLKSHSVREWNWCQSDSLDSYRKSCFNLQTPIRPTTAAAKKVARMARVTLSDVTFDPPSDGARFWESVENTAWCSLYQTASVGSGAIGRSLTAESCHLVGIVKSVQTMEKIVIEEVTLVFLLL